jgi:Tfp pilus assembly protein PilN
MFRRTTVIIPAAEANWEVWSCAAGRDCVWQGSADNPGMATGGARQVVVALPARLCRTLSFSAPTQDRQLVRKLAYAQLEKRGLAGASPDQTPFDCHLHHSGDDGSLVSVDVVTPAATTPAWEVPNARGFVPLPRLFDLPAGKLVILEEQGRLVLCAGADGRLVHSQIVSATRDLNGHAAPEIRIATLALQQQGVVQEVTGVELWGDFSSGDAQELSRQLNLPVQARARLAPGAGAVERESSPRLLPAKARLALGVRRRQQLRWAAVAAVASLALWWGFAQRSKLAALERRAADLERAVSTASSETGQVRAEQDRVRAAQQRWVALHLALEPRRYPLMVLNGLTRCIPSGGVVLARFESKVSELSATGTARSAMEAYTFFNAVSQDKELGVYGWSMVQPTIAADGTATFELKGQMR